MNKKLASFAVIASVVASFSMISAAYALTPTFSAFYTGNGDYVQINVTNTDANESVLLDSSSNIQSLGTTNSSGNFSATISTSQYNITPGSIVYVTVNGQESSSIQWPYTSGNTSFTLNQTSLSLAIGQSSIITASTGGPFFLSSNSSPAVANVSFNGSQITIAANTAGTTNLSICLVSNTASCQTETVSVSGSTSQTINFSQNNINIPIGSTATVSVSGGTGVYSISSNSAPTTVGATISGNAVSLYASNVAGSASITVCSTNLSSCGVINLTVGGSSTYSSLIFSNTAPSLSVGQALSITITGGVAPYYISSNSNSSIVQASVSGNVVTLSGRAAGSASITVCSNTNACQTLPVTVGSTSSGALTFGQSNVALTSGGSDTVTITGGSGTYYISSNSNGSVASAAVSGASVMLGGVATGIDDVTICSNSGQCGTIYVTVNGSGTTTNTGSALTLTQVLSVNQGINILLSGGTAPYSISSNARSIFSATINSGDILTLAGIGAGQSSVTVCSANSICMPVYVDVTAATSGTSGTTVSTIPASSGQYSFTTFLSYGSTGDAVTALQEQLTKDGIYTGPITGYYGSLTAAAVESFQSKHGIDSVGYVGPGTRTALNAGE
jgi:ferredoxin